MAIPILMPKPGQATEECTLILWLKAEGDTVRKGDVLFEIETDKSAMEVESFDEGVLIKQIVPAGATVPVNTVCAYIGQPGEAIPEAPVDAVQPPSTSEPTVSAPTSGVGSHLPPPGRAASVSSGAARPAEAAIRISPRATRLASSLGIDIQKIQGSGPEGRITERDVQAAAKAVSTPPSPSVDASHPSSVGALSDSVTQEVPGSDAEPMSRMRRVIADRLTQSWTTTPHFYVTVSVNLARLLAMRQDLKAQDISLSVTEFVLAATAQTLVEFPDVNARTDGASITRHPRVHLGLAVSIPGGLVVPVIRDADLLSVVAIHDRATELVMKARAGTLAIDEMTGSTFTVSNLGMFEVEEFGAIINPGEGAILAVASAVPTPVAVGDGIGVRPMMKMTLSADHRVVDGEVGARFLGALRRRLEDADSLRNQALTS
jgi:pyruvate dehydrogenase E2 component (dihydrolipoamide acetyltransferase)